MARARVAVSPSQPDRNVGRTSNYSAEMNRGPRDCELLLVVPTGEIETPLTREVGWWDAKLRRWEGDWRYYDGPDGYAKAEPVGWAELPEIDGSFLEVVVAPLVPATKTDVDVIDPAPVNASPNRTVSKAEKRATTLKPDPRPAKGKPGIDITTSEPVHGNKRKLADRPQRAK
jgi:hypothetical protein